MKTISDGLQPRGTVSLCLLLTAEPLMLAQTGNGMNLQIRADEVTARVTPNLHGLMTEEIDYSYEGAVSTANWSATVISRRPFGQLRISGVLGAADFQHPSWGRGALHHGRQYSHPRVAATDGTPWLGPPRRYAPELQAE